MPRAFPGVVLAVLPSLWVVSSDHGEPPTLVPVARPVLPVLAFPEPGIDDTASYQGYQTRFYRDSKDNTVQIYIQPQTSRVVLLWANAANESAGFSVRDAAGRPARVTWAAEAADIDEQLTTIESNGGVTDAGDPHHSQTRSIEYQLTSETSRLEIGWFVLGSMRIERDFVYAGRQKQPFTAALFQVAEESLLVAAVERLPPEERTRHLTILNAAGLGKLRSRLQPTISVSHTDTISIARIERPSLDGRDRLMLELRADPRKTKIVTNSRTVSLRTRPGAALKVTVKVSTTAGSLHALPRDKIFNRSFLEFLSKSSAAQDSASSVRAHRLERQVRGVELLSSEEKLMAGLPNFATYFGRDMMMSALMMRPIWTPEMSEHVITSVLRKLGPQGQVSHEEALGGQAIREHAVIYDSLIKANQNEQARAVLRDLQRTRENYHMIDDEFQLPVLVAEYLTDSAIPAERKRAFLRSEINGISSLRLLLSELALVASLTEAYVRRPDATNLVSFPKIDSTRWRSASWRDSDPGYAQGRFAMDINVIWVPRALESIAEIIASFERLGVTRQRLDTLTRELGATPLDRYLRDPASLRRAIDVWQTSRRHFSLTLSSSEIQRRVQAKLASLSPVERRYWQRVINREKPLREPLSFLALSLDSAGRPLPIPNTDPATELFLDADLSAQNALENLEAILRPYPDGLFVERLGPVVANDAYASRRIWERFEADQYHGPRVVWGREVNLLLLGLGNRLMRAPSPELHNALRRLLDAVHASGLQHNELWSYQITGNRLLPIRYGTSSDVQLWNTTNLVVQYVLSRLAP
jgi:hypothetical protein